MLSLSPAKIMVVLVVALIVLGPEKLPGLARQLGALWGDLRRWRSRLEHEVRGVFPDLPPTHEVAQVVRSPLTFLNRLADEHERTRANGNAAVDGSGVVAADTPQEDPRRPPAAPGSSEPPAAGVEPGGRAPEGSAATVWFATSVGAEEALPVVPDDPSMN